MRDGAGRSQYAKALNALEERVARWESLDDESLASELDALEGERRVEVERSGTGFVKMRMPLVCMDGLVREPGDPSLGPVTGRLTIQVMRARAAASASKIRADALAAQGLNTANARWSRLDHVKDWAFAQRSAKPQGSRAALIRAIAPQVRLMAKEAGEPLTGDDFAVIETITRWFRKARIS